MSGKIRKVGRPKTHKHSFTLRMSKGVHDYVVRQARDLEISISAFVENAIYDYGPPEQLHLGLVDPLSVPDIDGRVQAELEIAPRAGAKSKN